MTIYLDSVTFVNDFYTIGLSDGSSLVLNKLDEVFDTTDGSVTVNRISIERVDYDEDGNELKTLCSSVIGLGDDNIKIETDFTEYEGAILTEENMALCRIEV